jgi:eukaryotic-like serine/threonine-protein kinase
MDSVGRYTVIRKIGSGGMAEVFLARARGAEGTEKLLVLKKIHPALALNHRFIDMFVDEARVAMRLNHSNIVQVYAFEHLEGAYLLSMEYVDGPDLQALESAARHRRRRLPFGLSAFVAAEVAKGLDYAHSRRDDRGEPLDIVHRDVSPQNILVSRQGAVKIADFGIARARWLHEEASQALKGKVGYMAPEQAARRPVDLRSDVYSLGLVLEEMLVGRPMLDLRPGVEPLTAALEARFPLPRDVDPSIPPALDAIVARATARDPSDRYDTARAMAQALALYLHSLPEINDAGTLEAWIAQILPQEEAEPQPADAATGSAATTAAGKRRARETSRERALGEVERRSAILVSAAVEIEPHPGRADVRTEFFRLVGEMAYKAEGVLEVTNEGFRVFLGLIYSSMEDAIRALRLAYDVLDVSQSLSRDRGVAIRVRLAVSRGHARYRRDLADSAPVFTPESAALEDADQLLGAAATGEIVAGGGVFRLARREFNFDEPRAVGSGTAAGEGDERADMARAYKVIGAKSRAERSRVDEGETEFHGRVAELGHLSDALRRALGGRPVLLRVTGEMGIGKSRLVARFLRTVPPSQIDVVRAECLYAERDTPLTSVAALLRTVLALPEGDVSGLVGTSLEPLLPGAARYKGRQERFLEDLLESPASLWTRSGDGQRDLVRRAAFGLGVLLARRAAARPLVAVIDNAHWLDAQSVDVLSELARTRGFAPSLVLLVGHPATLAGRRIAGLESLEISELQGDVMRKIVAGRLGSGDGTDEVVEQVVARAHGNPFFAGEIIDSLIERRVVEPVAGSSPPRYRQARQGPIPLPTTMEGLAAARIDSLPQGQRTVLRAASAIGASFTLETLGRLVGRDVREDVTALVGLGLLIEAGARSGEQRAYRFRRPMDREAAYGGLAPQDLKRIHRSLAEELIAAAESGEGALTLRIAWHLERCGETERAGACYLTAADAAMAIYSSREALRLYERALPLLAPCSEARFGALARRELILKGLGRHKEREADVAEMERLARELHDGTLAAAAANRRAQLRYDLGDFASAAASLTVALELGVHAGAAAEQAESLRLLAYVASEEGHLIRALDCCDRALALVPEGEGGLSLKGRTENSKGLVLCTMGFLDAAPAVFAESLVSLRRAGNRAAESLALSNLALLARGRGELTLALEFFERALRIDAQIRDVSARGRKLANMGLICVELGDFEAAAAHFEESVAVCRDNQEPVGEIEARMGLAELRMAEGDPGAARELLEDLGRERLVSLSRILLTQHRQLICLALMGTGSLAAARRAAEEATRVALAAGMNGEAIHGGVLQGLVLAESGLHGEALAATRRATDLLADLGRVRRAERIWWLQALTLHKAGAASRAERALAEARREVERKRALIANPRARALYDAHPDQRAIRAGLTGLSPGRA